MILYRRTRDAMPANESEVEEALEEGIELITLVSPERFIAGEDGNLAKVECLRREVSNFDKSGRRNIRAIEGSNYMIDVDVVIPAVSQHADFPFIPKDSISRRRGERWRSTRYTDDERPHIRGGDITRGSDVAIRAIDDGKRAEASIDQYLGARVSSTGQKDRHS